MVYIQRFRTTFISPVHNAGFRGSSRSSNYCRTRRNHALPWPKALAQIYAVSVVSYFANQMCAWETAGFTIPVPERRRIFIGLVPVAFVGLGFVESEIPCTMAMAKWKFQEFNGPIVLRHEPTAQLDGNHRTGLRGGAKRAPSKSHHPIRSIPCSSGNRGQ